MPAVSRYLGWGEEVTYGEFTGATPYRADFAGESIEQKLQTKELEAPRFGAITRQVLKRRNVAGSVDLLLGWNLVGRVLKQLIGPPVTTGPASGIYTHVFTASGRTAVASLALDLPREVEMHRYLGCFFTGASVSIHSGDKHLGMKLNVLGAGEAAPLAIPSVVESDFEAPILVGDSSASPSMLKVILDDGSTVWSAALDSLDMQIGWNRQLRFSSRSQTPTGFRPGTFAGGQVRVRWVYGSDTEFLLNAFKARTPIDAQVVFVDGSKELRFHFPLCLLTGRPPTVRGPGQGNIELQVDSIALYSETDGYGPVQVTLKNTVASY